MVVDFHTHVFPEAIAEKTIHLLETNANIKACTRGTLAELLASMKHAGVDYSVVLPVVTKPKQFDSILKFAIEINKEQGILSFGGVHPLSENYKEELQKIKEAGLLGIKLHPEYQQVFIDDERSVQVIDEAMRIGLHVSLHCGYDVGIDGPIHSLPKQTLHMLSMLKHKGETDAQIILAHTGAYRHWDEVEQYLVGENVMLDLSFSLGEINEAQLLRIIREHGADRILFATDSPWADPDEYLAYMDKLDLTEEEKEAIICGNAKRLLHL